MTFQIGHLNVIVTEKEVAILTKTTDFFYWGTLNLKKVSVSFPRSDGPYYAINKLTLYLSLRVEVTAADLWIMSWDSYIDNLIAQSKDAQGAVHVDKACIIGLDGGAQWTSNNGSNKIKVKF